MSSKKVACVSDHMKIYGPEFSTSNPLERGQVFTMSSQLNDEKLLGWGYVRELEPNVETYTCKCGREFLGSVTDQYVRAHGVKWRGQCNPMIDLDEKVAVKSGAKPMLRGGTGDPDKGDTGWDVGASEVEGLSDADPYAGQRVATGKERPKRISLGG